MKYDDANYANNRWANSVVRLGDTPIFINHIHGDGNVEYWPTSGMNGDMKNTSLDELNLEPIPLGYCNHQGEAKYLTRIPMRSDWRQGVRERTLTHRGSGRNPPLSCLSRVVKGIYPTLQACVEAIVNKEVVSQAFSRTFAIASSNRLMYKGEEVGSYKEGGDLVLKDKYFWLRESLEETLNV